MNRICDFCGKEFTPSEDVEGQRHWQEVYGPGDWRLVCIPCLDVTEVEYGK